jgi:hypothetical protein
VNGIPVVTLTVRGLEAQIMAAISNWEADLSTEIQEAVAAACTPENVKRVISVEAQRAIDKAVREEVERFYAYGEGRKRIREAVMDRLGA